MNYEEEYKKAKKAGETEDLTPEFFQFDKKGDMIVGLFKARSSVQGRLGGEYNQYIFETDKGLVKFALGGASDAEVGTSFTQGVCYAIIFEGKVKLEGGRHVNKFTVEMFTPGGSEPVGGKDDTPF